ncbi:hypothetical protein WL21_07160 [Burkholderia ubonensis]|nr:hypothetical protein WL09_09595 [Burkholderia ubonensis]KVZ56453.1 hypothetical protein WL20_03075 [Burkholderia ubonensis]KVZ72313.1 hypothetical protein WL21_07160 [Burkholderia ubonensis]
MQASSRARVLLTAGARGRFARRHIGSTRGVHAFFCLKTRNAHLPFKQDHIARHTRRAASGRIAADADRA